MSPQCNFPFGNKCLPDIALLVSDRVTFYVCIGLRQAESEDDNQNGRAGAEPEEWAPAVRSGVDKTSRKCRGQKIAERIALLQHARNDSTSFLRAILESCCSSITIQTTHCNAEKCSAGKELLVGLTKSSS